MEYYTFEQLKEMAFSDGITGNPKFRSILV